MQGILCVAMFYLIVILIISHFGFEVRTLVMITSVPGYCIYFTKSNREAMNRNWGNQKANPALKTKTGHK